MDLMWPLWMMFRASGLSIKIQCKTSRMPACARTYINHQDQREDGGSGGRQRPMKSVPDEDSSLSNLLTSQSRLLENWVQLFLFPLINAAVGDRGRATVSSKNHRENNSRSDTYSQDVRESGRK